MLRLWSWKNAPARELNGLLIDSDAMSRVFPSDVVAIIEAHFLWVSSGNPAPIAKAGDSSDVAGLIEVLEQIPEELLPSDPRSYRDFLWSVASLRSLVRRLESGNTSVGGGWPFPTIGNDNVIVKIWNLMKECPDEAIAAKTTALDFIDDDEFRHALRQDLSTIDQDLNNGSWKSATILSGSAVEALLLWAIKTKGIPEVKKAVNQAASRFQKQPDPENPETWDLLHYIEVAFELGLITLETKAQALLAKDFRNFIHPGKEMRKKMRCDRGTARSAAAAVDHVSRDLERRFGGQRAR